MWEFARSVLGRMLRFLRSMHEYHDLAVLRADVGIIEPQPVRLVERTHQPNAALDACDVCNRSMTAERVSQRVAHGLRYFELYKDNRLTATTWIVWKGTRFVDEMGYHFPIPPRSFWIRDIFVAPEHRGQGMLSVFLDALLAGPFNGCDTVWSDVTADNAKSMNAHVKYGFREVSRMRGRRIGKLLLLRTREPEGFANIDGYEPRRRLVFTGPKFVQYLRQHLA